MESPHGLPLGEPTPAVRKGLRVQTCDEVSRGDLIEARVGSTRFVWGEVLDVHPTMELFWVLSPDGNRRIVELSEFEVYFTA